MKKKLTYLMLPVVIGIWGIIFYRIFFTGGNDPVSTIAKNSIPAGPADKVSADTFTLIADYRDPFLGKPLITTAPTTGRKIIDNPAKKISPLPVSTTWPAVSYSGMIRNQASADQLAILQVNGQSFMARTGEIVQGLKVMKIYRDSVEIAFGNDRKFFKK